MQEVSGYGLRRALTAGIQRVIAQRDEINRINVFPVPDGDTGTNLAFTLSAVLNALVTRRQGHAGLVMQRAASEAIDGARGNSGAILAQFLQGVSETMSGQRTVSLQLLAEASTTGSRLAREALAEPREGTILSVIQAFASELSRAVGGGARDFASSFATALERARKALKETPQHLAALRDAGVVDAGALGFVDLLEGIDDYIRCGRDALKSAVVAELGQAGVESANVLHGAGEIHRYCTECVVSADPVDRLALKASLLALPLDSLVLAGTREKVRVHAHIDEPGMLFEACRRHGRLSSEKADDMRQQATSAAQTRERVAIVADSGADIPAEELERLGIHLVPVRISFGARDFLDKVSLSPKEFYRELRDSAVPPRTSQPPPGDFRRMFEFLLSHHRDLVYVGLSRGLSGTLQSAETAAQRVDATRSAIIDTRSGSTGQGLLVVDAAEAAAAGHDAKAIGARVQAMAKRTKLFAVVRDLSYGVRGGRAPKLALPLQKLTGMLPFIKSSFRSGRLSIRGLLLGRADFPERFARKVCRRLNPSRTYRVLIGHCDCPDDGARVLAEVRKRLPNLDRAWLIEAGSAIGCHAGPGSLVIGVQDYEPLAKR